jgi:uncharacterized protein with HEPN domain
MAPATVPDRLAHVLHSVEQAIDYWQGKTFADFQADEIRRLATERHLEIISEASRHVPEADRTEHPEIPWSEIAAIGNVLRHRYYGIAEERIWKIVSADLSPWRTAIEQIVAKHGPRQA